METAVPSLFGCASESELKEHVRAQSLTSVRQRMNVRGVLREEGGGARRYTAMADVAPLDAVVSARALRLSAGLCNISADVVIPAPASQLHDAPMVGMALTRDTGEPLGAHRVLLLICGTEATDCDSVDPSLPMPEQIFKITSKNAKCLLSESEPAVTVTLVGYSDFKNMLAYRLDKETAVVLVSAVDGNVAGGPIGDGMVVTVEHMQKVSQDEACQLKVSMGAEWKYIAVAADAQAFPSPLSAKGQPYWSEERAAKLRRLQSEPTSPPPRKLDFGS